jgi:hypothetical protein
VPLFLFPLLLHGLIGGIDIVLNHELIAKLPSRPNAAPELRLHSARELVFAAIFFGLAWYEWRGRYVWVVVALFVAELLISIADSIVEVGIRKLPVTERATHVLLFVNLGILIALVGYQLYGWSQLPSEVVRVSYGTISWILSAMAAASLLWSVRDGASAHRRARQTASSPMS